MINLILIDDEQPALDEMEYLLKDYDSVHIAATFNEGKKALEYILLNDVDACFLDISMPEMDGFMLAEALIKLRKPPHIVFATAYDEYAIKAFEVNAIDYLLKPITEDRLNLTLIRLEEAILKRRSEKDAIGQLITKRYKDHKNTRVPLWKNDRIHLVNPSDICFLETKDGTTHIYTKKGTFESNDSLSHYEEILGSYNFYRCHRGFIIRLDSISEVIPWFNNTYVVKIGDYENEIPVSRRNVKEFRERLNL